MKKLFTIFIVLIALLASLFGAAYYLVDTEDYQHYVVDLVQEKTGYKLAISGDTSLSFFPSLALTLNHIALDTQQGQTLTLEKLGLQLAWRPLILEQRIHVEALALQKPRITIKQQEEKIAEKVASSTESEAKEVQAKEQAAMDLSQLQLKRVTIKDGYVALYDQSGELLTELSAINLDSAFIWQASVPFALSAVWLHPEPKLEERINIAGEYTVSSHQYSIKQVTAKLGEITALMQASFDQSQSVPSIQLSAKLEELAPASYMPSLCAAEGEEKSSPNQPPQSEGGGELPHIAASSIWSEDPIDVSILTQYAADVTLEIDRLRLCDVEVEALNIKTRLHDAVLKANIDNARIFGGTVTSATQLASTKQGAVQWNQRLDLEQLNIAQMPGDYTQYVNGTVSGALQIITEGTNQKTLINHARGQGSMAVKQAQLTNLPFLDIMQYTRLIPEQVTSLLGVKAAKSPQSEQEEEQSLGSIEARWTMSEGVVKNDDLHAILPVAEFKGAGNIDLNQLQIDYRITPMIKAEETETSFIPVVIRGPLHSPSIAPDNTAIKQAAQGELEKQAKALEDQVKKEVEDLGKNLEDQLKNQLQGILGGL